MTADSSQPPTPSPPEGRRGAAFATVWFALFIDLVAFGIIIPVLPYYAESFDASPAVVTLLSTSFSAAQFVMSPILGRISDRVGRRPVMLISIAGSAASQLLLGFAGALWVVFAARITNGTCNANVATAQAYVADRVEPDQRAKYMGLMGSAIGLGFVFGPAIGGVLSVDGHPELPFLVAAGLSALNWVLAFFLLPESRRPDVANDAPASKPVPGLAYARRLLWSRPIGPIVLANFIFYVAFSAMESTFALLMEARLHWGARETGWLFTGIGVVIVLTQGVLVGKLVGRLGERTTLLLGFGILAVGLLTTGLGPVVTVVVIGAVGIAGGNGLVTPSTSALISRSSDASRQGMNLGVASSGAALGRILGPAAAGIIFEELGPGVPMVIGSGLVVVAATAVALLVPPPRRSVSPPGAAGPKESP